MSGPGDPRDHPTLVSPKTPSGPGGTRAPGLSAGDVLSERFRIVRFIARGGMGEVHEAEDDVLRETVALKTIRPDVAADPRTMEHFLREVHLARSVTHPNVSRTFDVFHHVGSNGALAFLERTLGRAREIAAGSQHEGARREVLLASAGLRAAKGDRAGAARSLEDAAAKARSQGLLAWALEARLLEAGILARGGGRDAARVKLDAVEKDAAARGYRRIAREAREMPGA